VSQLDIISRTLHVLEQRVSMNEESVNNVMSYFTELREQKMNHEENVIRQTNVGYTAKQGQVINAYNQIDHHNVGAGVGVGSNSQQNDN
jgi:phosphomevalonate kinase